mmetsp:Transcript_29050/g.36007  ORF Transcript_29050/g.36007 Transcript_29050/m.36007 type:complete len:158 (-) Transcript_29050:439-912(-)
MKQSGAYIWRQVAGSVHDTGWNKVLPANQVIQGVARNLLNVTGTEFLVVDSYQTEVPVPIIDGKPNVIELLYTKEGITKYPTYPEPDRNAYQIGDTLDDTLYNLSTDTYRYLVPTGLKGLFSAEAGATVMTTHDEKSQIRAYVSKFPYLYFSGYSSV